MQKYIQVIVKWQLFLGLVIENGCKVLVNLGLILSNAHGVSTTSCSPQTTKNYIFLSCYWDILVLWVTIFLHSQKLVVHNFPVSSILEFGYWQVSNGSFQESYRIPINWRKGTGAGYDRFGSQLYDGDRRENSHFWYDIHPWIIALSPRLEPKHGIQ